ncbi:glycosyltransferase [Brevibacterium sediminis]|nr:glycosyltransferase [Brevibacterium sediminis]
MNEEPESRAELILGSAESLRIFILMSGSLTYGAAGLANSVISRATILSNAGYQVSILVDVWQRDINSHVARLRDSGRLSRNVDVRNIHGDLRNGASAPDGFELCERVTPRVSAYIGDLEPREDSEDPCVVRFYSSGRYRYFGYRRNGDSIDFLDELVDGKRKRRLFFSPEGLLAKTVEYSSGDAVLEEYFTANGLVYLRKDLRKNSGISRIKLLNTEGRYLSLRDDSHLLEHWFRTLVDVRATDVVISEYAFRFDALERVKSVSGTPVVYTLHSSHLASPFEVHSPIKSELSHTFSNAEKMSALVVLTPQQKLDIQKRIPHLTNVYAIPHAAPSNHHPNVQTPGCREPGLVVLVGRLSEFKGQRLAIQQFESVLNRVENARLEIWGRGPDERVLTDLVHELGLEDRIQMCGFTYDPASVYRRAEVALFPSQHEGQCLGVMEAMQEGAVPVCFDFKYGARMLVEDMVSGIITQRDDMADMLDSVVVLLQNSKFLTSLSLKAIDKVSEFSAERLVRDWGQLFSRVQKADG